LQIWSIAVIANSSRMCVMIGRMPTRHEPSAMPVMAFLPPDVEHALLAVLLLQALGRTEHADRSGTPSP